MGTAKERHKDLENAFPKIHTVSLSALPLFICAQKYALPPPKNHPAQDLSPDPVVTVWEREAMNAPLVLDEDEEEHIERCGGLLLEAYKTKN